LLFVIVVPVSWHILRLSTDKKGLWYAFQRLYAVKKQLWGRENENLS
jgi:hypothetical protein